MIDPERCKKVVNAIRDLSKTEVDELFKLLYKDNCEYTQNNNGIFFNLSWVSEETMAKIEQFVEFCNQSNTELVKYETLCDVLNHKLYENTKEVKEQKNAMPRSLKQLLPKTRPREEASEKDENVDEKKAGTAAGSSTSTSTKVSSSMRFYLLKKRFSKPIVMSNAYENDLMVEQYVL